jgi:hypothetical protein
VRKNDPKVLVGYALLGALAVGFFVGAQKGRKDGFFDVYGPNFVAEILGIFVTVFLVDHILRWQRERRLKPLKAQAFNVTRRELGAFLHFISSTYKASAPLGSPKPTSATQLLKCWQREVPWLDFREPAAVYPPRNWYLWAANAAKSFEEGFRAEVGYYHEVLGNDIIMSFRHVTEGTVFSLLEQADAFDLVNRQEGQRYWSALNLGEAGAADPTHLQEFVDYLTELIEAVEDGSGEPLLIHASTWAQDSKPAWGSSRYSGQSAPPDPAPFSLGN